MNTSFIMGVVVLYNPDEHIKSNIASYLNEIDHLYIIDNSEKVFDYSSISPEKITYIHFPENAGIAKALNAAASSAKNAGAEWLLTMDQDSHFEGENLKTLIASLKNEIRNANNIGLITPFHLTQTALVKENIDPVSVIKTCMTSGNIINLDAWEAIGGFNEDYFIDYVDHEYCLRLRLNNFQLLQANLSALTHSLGLEKAYNFRLGSFKSTNHNYIRRYYITRNRFYLISKYMFYDSKYCFSELYKFLAEFAKICIIEDRKIKKLKYSYFAIRDFFLNKKGKYLA